jgi:2-hydroxy-6-oxonona-2,4-dienedioate hydrolase
MSPREPFSYRSIRTAVAGVEMHAVVAGETGEVRAPSYVLVHGLGMSGRYLMPTARLLAASGPVYLPDLPGFGKSGKPATVLTISELADSLAEWLEAHRIEAPVLIGNSLGAQVIADLATRYPHRLDRAVLVAPTVDPQARRVLTQALRLLADIPREPVALYRIAVGDYFRAGFGRVLKTLRYALEHPISGKLPLVRCPVLVVRGGRDPIVPQGWVEEVARLIPGARLVTHHAAAHAVNFNSPEWLAEEILKFQRLP